MGAKPKAKQKTVLFEASGNVGLGKTGPIPCGKEGGFKIRVRLIKPFEDTNNWYRTMVALVDSRIPVGECGGKLYDLTWKEDPKSWLCGVWGQ